MFEISFLLTYRVYVREVADEFGLAAFGYNAYTVDHYVPELTPELLDEFKEMIAKDCRDDYLDKFGILLEEEELYVEFDEEDVYLVEDSPPGIRILEVEYLILPRVTTVLSTNIYLVLNDHVESSELIRLLVEKISVITDTGASVVSIREVS